MREGAENMALNLDTKLAAAKGNNALALIVGAAHFAAVILTSHYFDQKQISEGGASVKDIVILGAPFVAAAAITLFLAYGPMAPKLSRAQKVAAAASTKARCFAPGCKV